MYADLNNAKNSVPEPLPGETAEQYKARIIEEAETLYISGQRKADDYMVKTRRNADAYRLGQINGMKEELSKMEKAATKSLKETEVKRDLAAEELSGYRKEMDALAQQMYELKIKMNITDETMDGAVKAKRIEAGLELIRQEDPYRAQNIENEIEEAIARAQQREIEEVMKSMEH